MASQIFLLTGDNAFQIAAERSRWIRGFAEKHGDENYSRIEGMELSYSRLLDEIGVLPFTAQKRLVVVEGVPSFSKEEMEGLPKDIHPDVLLLFIDRSPDKRKSGTKVLLTIADVRDCTLLSGATLNAWIQGSFAKEGTTIEPDALRMLLSNVGTEQILLVEEIRKLALYAGSRPVTVRDIELLVLPTGERNVWQLMDLLSEGDQRRALTFVQDLLTRGETAAGLWPMLLWTVSQLTAVAGAAELGARSPQDVMKKSGVKFGPARSLLPFARRIDRAALQRILRKFAQADIDLKTGVLRSTVEAPQEAEAILDVCIAELCKK